MRRLILMFAVIGLSVTSAQEVEKICLSDTVLTELNNNTTTIEQQKDLLSSICTALSPPQSEYHLITIQQCRTLSSTKTVAELCADLSVHGYLVWISSTTYADHLRQFLDTAEVPILTLTNASTLDRIQSDQTFMDYQVLVELLPIRYEIQTATSSNHRIIKYIKRQILGSATTIQNVDHKSAIINGSIAYGFEGKTNVTFDDNSGIIAGWPVVLVGNETNGFRRDFVVGTESRHNEIQVNEFTKVVAANSSLNVSLEGTWTITEFDVTGMLQPIYSNATDGHMPPFHFTAKVLETAVTNVSRKYDDGSGNATIVTTLIPTLVFDEPHLASPEELAQRKQSASVYPGFRPYFHLACLIMFGVIFMVMADIVRQLLSERRARNSKIHYNDYTQVQDTK